MKDLGNLVLSRCAGQSVMVGDYIEVAVLRVQTKKVLLSFKVPKNLEVHRKEIWFRIKEEKNGN